MLITLLLILYMSKYISQLTITLNEYVLHKNCVSLQQISSYITQKTRLMWLRETEADFHDSHT